MMGCLLTHAVADQLRKSPFFFSRFNFQRMRKVKNTHYCFHCGGGQGFTPGPNGEATNHVETHRSNYNPMERHDPVAHAAHVITNADKYSNVWDWLETEIQAKGADFPYIVNVPSI